MADGPQRPHCCTALVAVRHVEAPVVPICAATARGPLVASSPDRPVPQHSATCGAPIKAATRRAMTAPHDRFDLDPVKLTYPPSRFGLSTMKEPNDPQVKHSQLGASAPPSLHVRHVTDVAPRTKLLCLAARAMTQHLGAWRAPVGSPRRTRSRPNVESSCRRRAEDRLASTATVRDFVASVIIIVGCPTTRYHHGVLAMAPLSCAGRSVPSKRQRRPPDLASTWEKARAGGPGPVRSAPPWCSDQPARARPRASSFPTSWRHLGR